MSEDGFIVVICSTVKAGKKYAKALGFKLVDCLFVTDLTNLKLEGAWIKAVVISPEVMMNVYKKIWSMFDLTGYAWDESNKQGAPTG